eukprot:GHVQ01006130.1.p1 GENE.GHVQ01006130.1~~GHVQ01006130.1.p1  ORF type:complete len:398 (-),score=55.77 GHVQ01006130.1:1635-2828(-)
MVDRDLDEAEEQHQLAARAHLLNIEKLLHNTRLQGLHKHFLDSVGVIQGEFRTEQEKLQDDHSLIKQELQVICQQVENEEKIREQEEITEHTTQYEVIRNKNIEEDHEMKSKLEEQIEHIKDKCHSALQNYRGSTETNAQEYKKLLQQDSVLSRKVDQRLRQVEKMQTSIAHWKNKIQQNKKECEARNAQLRTEKEVLQKHFQELKSRMNRFRDDERKRLTDISTNARDCEKKLQEQLELAEKIIRTAELSRKFETEREKVIPFYASRDISVEEVPWENEELKEEIKESLGDDGIDEWTYLDTFFKRYNKVLLDKLAIKKEYSRLTGENQQLKSILRQFLDGVSVNEQVLSGPNPLLVINGRVNLNHVPVKVSAQGKVFVEAATHVPSVNRGPRNSR